ncbi:MAG: DUF4330 domain-containing protein [Oscillospiraceae bacterium]|nr:DUF4330 domain-containing protein [Oscillospiraceae bacterium]
MKKIIDENGRLFGKVSIVDIVVIVAVLAVAIAAVMKRNVVEQVSGAMNTVPVSYTIAAMNIRVPVAELLQEGDYIWLESGVPAGIITGVEIRDAIIDSQKADGTYVIGKIESKVDAYITVHADCSVSGGSYYADRTFALFVNQEQKYITKYVAVTGIISDISPEAE